MVKFYFLLQKIELYTHVKDYPVAANTFMFLKFDPRGGLSKG